MATTWAQHDRLDSARVGMFGFSLGGSNTLVEIGGIPDVSRMRERLRVAKTTAQRTRSAKDTEDRMRIIT
jgi:predicted dienelactone hydrolase